MFFETYLSFLSRRTSIAYYFRIKLRVFFIKLQLKIVPKIYVFHRKVSKYFKYFFFLHNSDVIKIKKQKQKKVSI